MMRRCGELEEIACLVCGMKKSTSTPKEANVRDSSKQCTPKPPLMNGGNSQPNIATRTMSSLPGISRLDNLRAILLRIKKEALYAAAFRNAKILTAKKVEQLALIKLIACF